MLANLQLTPVLAADFDTIGGVITFVVVVIGWIVRLVSTNNQARPPAGNRPRPPARPRDDRLQQEINIFIEEQKRPGAGSRPANAAAARPPQGKKGAPAGAQASKQQRRKPRPGQEMAGRQAPVTETLGKGVKQHLSQYMTDKVSQEVQTRMAPRVDAEVADDLGTTVTFGTAARATAAPAKAATSRADRFAELLRSPAGIQQAIVLNLILSPPVSRAQSPRR